MNIDDLKRIVREFNGETLRELLSMNGEQTDQISLPDAETASVKIPRSAFPHRRGYECFCGRTSGGYDSSGSFVDTCLSLPDPMNPGSTCLVAAGAVIDAVTKHSTEDLPVVLAVGINYGQRVCHVPLFDITRMLPRLKQVFSHLATNKCPSKGEKWENDYHLVASNFLPWITNQPWSEFEFNSIEEATLIHCCGHVSPEEYIMDLVSRIQPHIVVFHGANNAVPYIGGCLIRRYLQSNVTTDFEVIFSDNLAPGIAPGISNAIKLGCCNPRNCLPSTDFDE